MKTNIDKFTTNSKRLKKQAVFTTELTFSDDFSKIMDNHFHDRSKNFILLTNSEAVKNAVWALQNPMKVGDFNYNP